MARYDTCLNFHVIKENTKANKSLCLVVTDTSNKFYLSYFISAFIACET